VLTTAKVFSLSLCAALLIGTGAVTAMAQMGPGRMGRSRAPSSDTMVGNPEHGEAVAAANCASCHGSQGNGVEGNSPDLQVPKLAGQNPAYLYWQLWAFKTGNRKSDVMSGIVAALSDDDLADVASFFARQPMRPDPLADTALAATGKRIVFAGAERGRVPACAQCHDRGRGMPMMGMMGRGAMANIPNLNGQHADYIVQQLNRFASGERPATVMGRIAAAMSENDRKAVAAYLSSVP
jgi:cytochrome c553